MRRPLLAAALLLGTVGATTAPPLTLEQQAKKADVIVRATVGTPASVTENGVTYQVYPLTVRETIAGDAAALPRSGEAPALYFLSGMADVPVLKSGDDIFALLYARRLDSPLVGFNQGLYPVTNGAVKAKGAGGDLTDPTKLRDALRAAREAK